MKSLSARTIHGISWNLIATVSNTVLQIAYTAIMARLLTPSDFGLMAMAMVVIKFGDYFSKMGMAQTLVQKPDLNNDDIRSVFTTSVALGLLFTSLMFFFAPLFKYVFENEQVVPVIKVLSINFLLKGLSITSLGLLGKELEFKKLATINMTTFLMCNIGFGVYLAYSGFGVYSLIYAGISQQIIMLAISYSWTRHDVRPLVSWKVYKPLLSYGGRISVISIFEYIGASLDTFFIAKFYGALSVGLYNKARMLVYLPTYQLTTSVSRVIYPAFSKLQSNKEKLGKAYLSTITLMSAVLFPICFGVFSASREIVLVVLGEQWSEAIPVLKILTFAIPFILTSQFSGILCNATANLNSKLLLQLTYVLLLSTFFFLFRHYNFVLFPIIILVGELIRNIVYVFLVSKITVLRVKDILSSYLPGLFIAVLVAIAIYLITFFASYVEIPDLLTLLVQMITGGVVLGVFTLIYPHKELQKVIIERFSRTEKINIILQRLKWYKH